MHHHAFFNDKSDLYRAARPGYPDELLSYVAGLAPSKGIAWDCATGNGQAAIGLAKHFSVVHATDVSENQIAHAIPNERIVYAAGVAEKSSFDSATIDLVTVAQALHWFEYSKFWPEIVRVLKPGGVFAAWGYDWFKVDADVDNMLQRTLLDRIESYWAPRNRILWDGYQGVPFPFEKLDTPTFQLKLHWDLVVCGIARSAPPSGVFDSDACSALGSQRRKTEYPVLSVLDVECERCHSRSVLVLDEENTFAATKPLVEGSVLLLEGRDPFNRNPVDLADVLLDRVAL